MKEKILILLEKCKEAVLAEDIPEIISLIRSLNIDTRTHNPLTDYVRDLIITDISKHVTSEKSLRITRKGEYGTDTFDTYTIKDGILNRNGHSAQYDNVGKLYQAYKKIHKL